MLAARYNNNEEVVLELLRAGANVNEKDKVSELLTYYYYYFIVCCCRMSGQLSCWRLVIIIMKKWCLSW